MKKYLNNKGFSLIELLAAVTILGILMLVAVVGYSKYIDKAKKDSIDIFNKSAISAAEEYFMDNPYEENVSVGTLIDDNYLEVPGEKVTDGKSYSGKIEINGNNYKLYMCFAGEKYIYYSNNKTKEKLTDISKCN